MHGVAAAESGPRRWTSLAFLLLPVLLGLGGLMGGRAIRPLWVGGSIDPGYPYLLNSLQVAELSRPAFISHPGTPLQVLGAVVIRVRHLLVGTGPLRDAVLAAPDSYAEPIRVALLVAIVLANAFQGWAAYRLTRSAAAAALVQLTPLLSPPLLLAHLQVLCEALLLALSLAVAGLVMWLAREGRATHRWAGLSGLLVGVGTATKLTFAGLAIVPLALTGGRARRLYVAAALASFGVALLPIAGGIPILLEWVGSLWLRSGDYGQGPRDVIDGPRYLASLARLVTHDPMGSGAVAVVIIAIAGLVWAACWRTRREAGAAGRALSAVLGVVVLSWLVAAKSSAGFNYIVPALGLSGSLIALTVVACRTRLARGALVERVVTITLLVAVPVQAGAFLVRYIGLRRPAIPGALEARERVRQRGGESRAVLGNRASTVAASMAYANEWAGHAYSDDLRRIYPETMSFDRIGFNVFGRQVEAAELGRRLHGDALLLWDTTWEQPLATSVWASGARLEELGRFGRERLYLAHLTPPDAEAGRGMPFAGLLVLRGLPDLSAYLGPTPDREALGPVVTAVFFGDGRAIRLHARFRNERDSPQRVELRLNGDVVDVQELGGASGWTALSQALQARAGLNEVRIAFDETYGPLDESFAFRVPGYARSHLGGERTGVRFERLQVLSEP